MGNGSYLGFDDDDKIKYTYSQNRYMMFNEALIFIWIATFYAINVVIKMLTIEVYIATVTDCIPGNISPHSWSFFHVNYTDIVFFVI